ncbi:hypothetical protein BH11MYX2_BH11MYX2_32790 [soil metagenome]
MELLFSSGALVFAIGNRFWAAAAIALAHIIGLALLVVSFVTASKPLQAAGAALYLVALISAFIVYSKNRALEKTHPRRETSQLLGAVACIGGVVFLIATVVTLLAARHS